MSKRTISSILIIICKKEKIHISGYNNHKNVSNKHYNIDAIFYDFQLPVFRPGLYLLYTLKKYMKSPSRMYHGAERWERNKKCSAKRRNHFSRVRETLYFTDIIIAIRRTGSGGRWQDPSIKAELFNASLETNNKKMHFCWLLYGRYLQSNLAKMWPKPQLCCFQRDWE